MANADSIHPPLPEVTRRLREHLDRHQDALLHAQAIRREHASERQLLREATHDLRRWREDQQGQRCTSST
jgi:hypothetical protein